LQEWEWPLTKADFYESLDEKTDGWSRMSQKKRAKVTAELNLAKRTRKAGIKHLEAMYKASRPAWVRGLKYKTKPNGEGKWTAYLQYQRLVPEMARKQAQAKPEMIKQDIDEIIELDRLWVKDTYGQFMVDHLIEKSKHSHGKDDEFTMIPSGRGEILYMQKKVHSVKYTAAFTRETTDQKAKKILLRQQEANNLYREKLRHDHLRDWKVDKDGRTVQEEMAKECPFPDADDPPEWPPTIKTEIPEKWTALSEDGDPFTISRDFLVEQFGKRFVEEIQYGTLKKGFCHVPVGDYRPSTLRVEYPSLCIPSAPLVRYQQNEGTDLCAFKSLASVMHALGWEEEAKMLNLRGEQYGKGSTGGFEYLKQVAVDLFPGWLQVRRVPKRFSLQDVAPSMVAVLVLTASDGNCSHAVSTHGGYLYDANEEIAIPSVTKGSIYCCSNEEIHAEFVDFKRGWIFEYQGKAFQKTLMMTQPKLQYKS